jgi:aminotransferase in exopolysaccharide biosynthesis
MGKLIPLCEPSISGNEWKYVKECLDTGWVSTAGAFVERFERELASYAGSSHAIAVSSGTAALHTALVALSIGPGDEVLVPSLTFIAPVNAVRYVGAEPVFIGPDDHINMSPAFIGEFISGHCDKKDGGLVNRKTGRRVRAVIPVHVFGHPADMESIMDIADEHGLYVVEDATESLGSLYTEGPLKGRHTGTIGKVGCYSFNGNKIITTGGGGMLVTDDEELAARMRYLSTQAKDDSLRYIHNEVGYNYRMTNLQAAMGVAQLEQLDAFVDTKRRNFELYRDGLSGLDGISLLEEPSGTRSNYWFYSLLLSGAGRRDSVMEALGKSEIQSRPIWHPNHLQKPYEGCEVWGEPGAEAWHSRVLSIPCSVGLTSEDIGRVCEVLGRD